MTSFEGFPVGPFTMLNSTEAGQWEVSEGKAAIDGSHAASGKNCLHLLGGPKTSLIWTPQHGFDPNGLLTFRCERWTARAPFFFRIEKDSGGGWEEVCNADDKVRVGRSFLTKLEIPLDDSEIKRIRFTVSSPEDTGILIDDLRIIAAVPQEIVAINPVPLVYPSLIGADATPAIVINVRVEGFLNPISITGLELVIDDAAATNLDLVEFRMIERSTRYKVSEEATQSRIVNFPHDMFVLKEGENEFVVACKPRATGDMLRVMQLQCKSIHMSNGESFILDHASPEIRIGVALRDGRQDNVDTYRIPGLATTNQGTLIAVYDVRYRGGADLPADIDIGMSRSTDGGLTWEPMRIILDMGNDPQWSYDGVGDPAILVDRKTGSIWVAGLWSHGNRGWHGSGQGIEPNETGQLMLVHSEDDGETWSEPINVTGQVKLPEWCLLLQGPGKGISMSDGTLVFAAQFQAAPSDARLPYSTILYSKDHGKTWGIGTGAYPDTTEAQVVELEPGVLMLNCRYNRKSSRVIMVTHDLGKTWERHPTSEQALIEPRACMASLIRRDEMRYDRENDWLFFSNPNSLKRRERLTIKASRDLGQTWPESRQLLLDQGGSAGYSCLTIIDDATLGILYEGSQAQLTFQRIPIRLFTQE